MIVSSKWPIAHQGAEFDSIGWDWDTIDSAFISKEQDTDAKVEEISLVASSREDWNSPKDIELVEVRGTGDGNQRTVSSESWDLVRSS